MSLCYAFENYLGMSPQDENTCYIPLKHFSFQSALMSINSEYKGRFAACALQSSRPLYPGENCNVQTCLDIQQTKREDKLLISTVGYLHAGRISKDCLLDGGGRKRERVLICKQHSFYELIKMKERKRGYRERERIKDKSNQNWDFVAFRPWLLALKHMRA